MNVKGLYKSTSLPGSLSSASLVAGRKTLGVADHVTTSYLSDFNPAG